MSAYYNEIDPSAAAWLRRLIAKGLIADGEVDERSIEDVKPDDLLGFTQCHFFAGIGGWSYALRLAGWQDDQPVWTGSCPCQPFSAAGKGNGFTDERHLWPAFFHLIENARPEQIFGEQVAGKDGAEWLGLVCDDLEAAGYDIGAVIFPSHAVGSPQLRERTYFGANTPLANAAGGATDVWRDRRLQYVEARPWPTAPWTEGNAYYSFVDDGLPAGMVKGALKGLGNAINPVAASEFIKIYMGANQ